MYPPRDAVPTAEAGLIARSSLRRRTEVESNGSHGRSAREGGREAARFSHPGHAVSVTGMFTTLIFEPSIALTSYTRIVPGWVASTS